MKTHSLFTFLVFAGLTAAAQTPFDSGSIGPYGPMNITSNTVLDLPPDGIFHCTTITVEAAHC